MKNMPKLTKPHTIAKYSTQVRFHLWIVGLLVLFIVGGCKSYKVVPNGYIVRGDDTFVSVNERIMLKVGSDLLNADIWERSSPPLKASRPTWKQKRLLKKLGYSPKHYEVLFVSDKKLPFQLIALVNSFSLSKGGKSHFIDLAKLSRNETDSTKWYDQQRTLGSNQVYHAVIPVSEKLFAERYISLIYFNVLNPQDLKSIADIAAENSRIWRSPLPKYATMKTVEYCPNEEAGQFYDYFIPKIVKERAPYSLIQVFEDAPSRKLVYYTLLEEKHIFGAFRLCKGQYTIVYTTLDNEVIVTDKINID